MIADSSAHYRHSFLWGHTHRSEITSMCVSVCIFVSFTVFYCTSCIAFFLSFTYTVYQSVCMSLVYVYGPCCLI